MNYDCHLNMYVQSSFNIGDADTGVKWYIHGPFKVQFQEMARTMSASPLRIKTIHRYYIEILYSLQSHKIQSVLLHIETIPSHNEHNTHHKSRLQSAKEKIKYKFET